MVKLLFFLTILFFTITSMFFVFLTKFNEESKRAALMSKVAGAMMVKNNDDKKGLPWQTPTTMVTSTITVPTEEPTPTKISKKTLEIKLGEMNLQGQRVEVIVKREVEEAEQFPISNSPQEDLSSRDKFLSEKEKIPWQVFDLKLFFPENILPGSSDNKIIFENKEYEIRVLNSKGDALNSFMFKIDGAQVIINPENGIWEGNAEFAVAVYSDGNKIGDVKFAVE